MNDFVTAAVVNGDIETEAGVMLCSFNGILHEGTESGFKCRKFAEGAYPDAVQVQLIDFFIKIFGEELEQCIDFAAFFISAADAGPAAAITAAATAAEMSIFIVFIMAGLRKKSRSGGEKRVRPRRIGRGENFLLRLHFGSVLTGPAARHDGARHAVPDIEAARGFARGVETRDNVSEDIDHGKLISISLIAVWPRIPYWHKMRFYITRRTRKAARSSCKG